MFAQGKHQNLDPTMLANFDDYPGFQPFFTLGKHFVPKCIIHASAYIFMSSKIQTKIEDYVVKMQTHNTQ